MFTIIKKYKSNSKPKETNKGFSLIELVIYMAGMVALVTVLILMIVQIYGLYRQITIVPRSDRIGLLTVDRIVKDIRSGQSIDIGQSSFGAPEGVLFINAAESASFIEKEFYIENGRIVYEENGDKNYLSPADLEVTKLQFEHLTTGISEGVRVEIDITFNNGDELVTKEYDGFAILRQSYE